MDPGVERQTNEKNRQPRRRHEYDAEQRADVQRRIIIDPVEHGGSLRQRASLVDLFCMPGYLLEQLDDPD